jgi:hypothetical protein
MALYPFDKLSQLTQTQFYSAFVIGRSDAAISGFWPAVNDNGEVASRRYTMLATTVCFVISGQW